MFHDMCKSIWGSCEVNVYANVSVLKYLGVLCGECLCKCCIKVFVCRSLCTSIFASYILSVLHVSVTLYV
jgi:hypothetical protein